MLEKWHSLGNDFLISTNLLPPSSIKMLCDRNFGIGADQFILLEGKNVRFFNSDGSEAELCGNALKCVGEIIYKNTSEREFELTTKRGIVKVKVDREGFVEINLGSPIMVKQIKDNEFFVNLGNPHYICIIQNFEGDFFNSNLITEKLTNEGKLKQIEFAESNGINFSLVFVDNNKNLLARTFERGVGETLSCGSGACACFVACYKSGIITDKVSVFNKGSKKVLDFRESFHLISYSFNNSILLKGKGTKVAEIKIEY